MFQLVHTKGQDEREAGAHWGAPNVMQRTSESGQLWPAQTAAIPAKAPPVQYPVHTIRLGMLPPALALMCKPPVAPFTRFTCIHSLGPADFAGVLRSPCADASCLMHALWMQLKFRGDVCCSWVYRASA